VTLGRGDLPATFRRFGFLTPERIANWTGAPPPDAGGRPLGMIVGGVHGPLPGVRIRAATLGCAACHAGTTYDAAGMPTGEAWLGLPNTSLDVEAYTRAVYAALRAGSRDTDALADRVEALFPEMGRAERFTLRRLLLPRVKTRIGELAAGIDAPVQVPGGGPGRTNGVGALKVQLGLLAADRMHPETGFTSIPDLAGRRLRSSLLYDGTFAPPGTAPFVPRTASSHGDGGPGALDSLAAVVVFFTVPTMGMPPGDAERAIPRVREVMGWLDAAYAPPPFPGPVDAALSARGEALFTARCAACHGTYAGATRPRRLVSFPNRLVPQGEMGTDPARWQAIDSTLVSRLGETAYRRHVAVRRTGGYVAPILSGVWATAPYLHNGSVPTLRHLLTPAERPVAFETGGHRLDFARVGIAGETAADGTYRYPAGYRPWSRPERLDTRAPGLSKRGHEREFAPLTEDERRALIEYLKEL
jgi:mono/diheme cytochrome c family protein